MARFGSFIDVSIMSTRKVLYAKLELWAAWREMGTYYETTTIGLLEHAVQQSDRDCVSHAVEDMFVRPQDRNNNFESGRSIDDLSTRACC